MSILLVLPIPTPFPLAPPDVEGGRKSRSNKLDEGVGFALVCACVGMGEAGFGLEVEVAGAVVAVGDAGRPPGIAGGGAVLLAGCPCPVVGVGVGAAPAKSPKSPDKRSTSGCFFTVWVGAGGAVPTVAVDRPVLEEPDMLDNKGCCVLPCCCCCCCCCCD
jgi:hypothetical protein